MAKQLKKIFDPSVDEVVQNFTVNSWHVSQSVDALTGVEDYDITISGSLTVTGSVKIEELDTDVALTNFVVIDTSTGQLKKRTGGNSGSSGSSGTSGTSGTGTNGSSGTSGTSGISIAGPAGNDGSSGSSGTSGTSADDITGLDTQVLYFDGDDNPAGDSELTWDNVNKTLRISSADNGTSGKNNLILTNDIASPTLSNTNFGNIVGKLPDDSTGIIHSKIEFGADGSDWVYASGEWKIAPSAIRFYTSQTNYTEPRMKIWNDGKIKLYNYNDAGNFLSNSPNYNLGVDTVGNIVQISPYYSGSNYEVVTETRIDYNSYTANELTGNDDYQFLISPLMTDIPNANQVVIKSRTKNIVDRVKINIGANTEAMNIVTPVSMSRLIMGNGINDYASYNVKTKSLLNDPIKGDYLDMTLEYVTQIGANDFTVGSDLQTFQFSPQNTTSTTTIYPIKNYYTRISFGNLSDDAIDTLFGFWLDENFRANLNTGDELTVEAKWFSDVDFGENGGDINFITFNTRNGNTLRRQFIGRTVTPSSTPVYQVSTTNQNYGKTQIFKFQYWERSSTEYGLMVLSTHDSYFQPSVLS